MADGEVTVHIDAPPERVYELIADVTRMGRWSPECYRCAWQDGATSAAVGARFKGSNRQGLLRWSTTAEVVAAEPGRAFAFTTVQGDREVTRWRYTFAPAGGGTDATESYERVWEPGYVKLAEKLFLRGRDGQLERGMQATLQKLKNAAEGPETPTT
jgi:uncharacterized protein YndB with AHSA1/START domain